MMDLNYQAHLKWWKFIKNKDDEILAWGSLNFDDSELME